jgi:Fe-Mn family superoxide dismutase
MNFDLAPLPYAKDALQPFMSAETLEYHYEKHHRGYLEKLKALLVGRAEASGTLEEIVKHSSGGIFNNAAQVWNHTFFWESMQPGGGGPPTGELLERIDRDFGGWEKFKEAFKTKGMARFGSGWVWLVLDDGKLRIVTTSNAGTPLTMALKPLLTCDVWEHAYYIDYRNQRERFLEAFCDHLINWDFAARNLRSGTRPERVIDAGAHAHTE